ncbi:meiosis-specific APC/C activator protein AMA1 [Nannizzia gypsea CBS 118893]|uniref:Meiosis-specific APC/C activator protein AMA1 n=1 Tax=Arthroderma gypseum (strain ATCC MYA-4604 / CBS 118893) TaxID=535722 RepID=E4V1I2_ARTGP|nr:meiosis-specific APC/C activator protein AMA1 [Nannizzia gypsea CBS 118893]EFR03897.1 meiosis-specific APC/C activator protein AMA1 [Nannizzia gypsea CBS 118893]
MPSYGDELETFLFPAGGPSVAIFTSYMAPEPPRRLTQSPLIATASPAETEPFALFLPAISRRSQRKAATSNNDVFLIRNLEEPSGPNDDPGYATASYQTTSMLSYNTRSSPDRFLPIRDPYSPSSLPFRLSRNPVLLSPVERSRRLRDPTGVFAYPPPHAILNNNEIGDPRIVPHQLPRYINHGLLSEHPSNPGEVAPTRRVRTHAVWNFQGSIGTGPSPCNAVSNGRGGLFGSGTVAPLHIADFLTNRSQAQDDLAYESRLAFAINVDQAARVLNSTPQKPLQEKFIPSFNSPIRWSNGVWKTDDSRSPSPKKQAAKPPRPVPSTPFRVLDAPFLRDDFYCSTLAYCYTARVLAVGLGHKVYIWSEGTPVKYPPFKDYPTANYVTSLSFSSYMGGHSILAVARQGGQVTLWSTFDSEPRFEFKLPHGASCICFKGCTTRRTSSRNGLTSADMEELAIGDEFGQIWCYSVEWTNAKWRKRYNWDGAVRLLAKISAHTQQVCGVAWSPDGMYLATGGNDNICLLFDFVELIKKTEFEGSIVNSHEKTKSITAGSALSSRLCLLQSYFHCGNTCGSTLSTGTGTPETGTPYPGKRRPKDSSSANPVNIPMGSEKHKFTHAAAVKAIAFAPWQPSLMATGGGTNDRCIRFFHVVSGACLAIINVHSQVTSLIWSKTRREIAATFGYASPDHPYRIAVFAWPSCQQVVAIPWVVAIGHERFGSLNPGDCGRALCAISYPGGPNEMARQLAEPASRRGYGHGPNRSDTGSEDSQSSASNKEGDTWWSRTAEEGCIIVASSDESVKFHEVWSGTPKSIAGTSGVLGGSAILEGLEGIEKETEIIR